MVGAPGDGALTSQPHIYTLYSGHSLGISPFKRAPWAVKQLGSGYHQGAPTIFPMRLKYSMRKKAKHIEVHNSNGKKQLMNTDPYSGLL